MKKRSIKMLRVELDGLSVKGWVRYGHSTDEYKEYHHHKIEYDWTREGIGQKILDLIAEIHFDQLATPEGRPSTQQEVPLG